MCHWGDAMNEVVPLFGNYESGHAFEAEAYGETVGRAWKVCGPQIGP
jgi:hypothetical protein